jgi:hypothetical protein
MRPEAPQDPTFDLHIHRSGEGRIARSWRLTRTAAALVRADRTLLVIALAASIAGLAGAALIFGLSGISSGSSQSQGRLLVVVLLGSYPLTFVSVYFNVALVAAAAAALEGRRLTLSEAFAVSRARLGQIAAWALFASLVGLVLREVVARIPGGGRLVAWLLGAAWSLATLFAVPILALEGAGALDCARRSGRLIRSRWGEGLSGTIAISGCFVLVAIPVALLLGIGIALVGTSPALGLLMLLLAIVALVVLASVAGAVRQVFAVALYRFAAEGLVQGFSERDLQAPFGAKRGGFRLR